MADAREEPQEGATRHTSEGRGCGKWLQLGGEMEADDLLCSRNARPETGLVGRAQWKTIQPPSPQKEAPLLLCYRGEFGLLAIAFRNSPAPTKVLVG